nr:uncharacterized protein LOC127322829 [Lolium perenne]
MTILIFKMTHTMLVVRLMVIVLAVGAGAQHIIPPSPSRPSLPPPSSCAGLAKPCRNFSSTSTTTPSCCWDSEGIYHTSAARWSGERTGFIDTIRTTEYGSAAGLQHWGRSSTSTTRYDLVGFGNLQGYEEGASIARGGEEQLDQKMDVKLDMKTSHGHARDEREECARGEAEVQAGARSGPTGRAARPSGPRPGPTGSSAGSARFSTGILTCAIRAMSSKPETSPGHHPAPGPV